MLLRFVPNCNSKASEMSRSSDLTEILLEGSGGTKGRIYEPNLTVASLEAAA